jgi:hypothetical protein
MDKVNAQILRLKQSEIDRDKWDKCINEALNSRVYALSWYLDITCPNWEGLVYGDYEYVLPLTITKKLGLELLLRPPYSQQLGIFPSPDRSTTEGFLKYLEQFKLVEYPFNSDLLPITNLKAEMEERPNFVLPLYGQYEAISGRFSKHCKRQIKKAEKNQIQVTTSSNIIDFIEQTEQNANYPITPKTKICLQQLLSKSIYQGNGIIQSAYDTQNRLCASVFWLRHRNRIYYLSAFSTSEGKKQSAMYALIHEMIRTNSGTQFVIDFEGSTIEGIARLYKGFGATAETYFNAKLNQLPWPLNHFYGK